MEYLPQKYKRYPRKKKKQLQKLLAGRVLIGLKTSKAILPNPFDREWITVQKFIYYNGNRKTKTTGSL